MSVRRRLIVEADGGSRGNPGVAGYGALVRDPENGAVLAERARPIGIASNNVAEYRGLIAGLEAAHELEPGADVEARMDSKLVVEQMSGRWKIKHEEMRRLAARAREVVRSIESEGGSVRFTWVPRAQNRAADTLSNVAMDGGTIDRDPVDAGARDDVDVEELELGATPGRGAEDHVPTRLLLVRHGATAAVDEGRLDGRGGAERPLTDAGHTQAEAAGRAAAQMTAGRPVRLVTSSLAGAVQTGRVLTDALGVTAEVDPDWDEQAFGAWDGRIVRDLVEVESDDVLRWRRDPTWAPSGGESHVQLTGRVLAALERVLGAGGTTVVVSHRAPILVVLEHVLGLSAERSRRLAIAPGSLTAIEFWDDDALVAFTNRT